MDSAQESLVSTQATIGGLNVGGPAQAVPAAVPAAVQQVAIANSLLLQRVEALIAKADTIIQSDALRAKGYIEKYWPIVAGVLIAATRLL